MAAASGWGDGLNRTAPAAVAPPSDATPDADTPAGGYVSAQPASSGTAEALAGSGQAAQPASAQQAADSSTDANMPGYQMSYPSTSTEDSQPRYPNARADDSASEYYPAAHTATHASITARAAEPASTAVLRASAPLASVLAPRLVAGGATPTAVGGPPPQPVSAPVPPGVRVQPDLDRPEVQSPGEAALEARPSGFAGDRVARADEGSVSAAPDPEAIPLFPLALPLPGGLVSADLPAWERGVRELFRRLDALAGEPGEQASWGRLAPWYAALGTLTVALELVRRRLDKRYPADLAEVRGRGLAWSWSHDPEGREPPEHP
jgi:hypothetical protein